MALVDLVAAYGPVHYPSRAINAVACWIAARRARRARRVTLQSLLEAPEHRLRDLGISREELVRAMEIHRK